MTPFLSKTLLIPSSPLLRRPTRSLLTLPHSPARPMTSEPARRIFQLKLDPLTGNSEWVVIDEETEEAFGTSNNASFLATTSYLDMLNDSTRNRAYRQAIDKTITRPCHVVDIGAGTGLLSMMAVRAMGGGESAPVDDSGGWVTACESYLPMVKLMKKVVRANGMARNIRVVNKRSDELTFGVDIASRADVLVSEILDSELLGEGLIPTLQHAHDMLLVDNPLTVPYRATTYGQLVESSFLWKLHDLYNNEAKATDGIHLVPAGLDTILCVKPQQHPIHCDAISREIKLLSDPFKIFEFDFWKRPDSHGETEHLIKATSDGRVHAVVSWWELQLDREGTIFYSTAPRWIALPENISTEGWCDHWKQCAWFVPGKGLPISKGEDILFYAAHTSTSVLYNLSIQGTEIRKYGPSDLNFHLTLSPERIAIYGDSKWRSSMLAALKIALQARVHHLCIVADDSVYLTLLVSHHSTSHVISLFPGLRDRGEQYLRAVAKANGLKADRVEVFPKKYLTLQDTNQKKVDLLIGEPYYHGNDGMLPWQNLRFWKERTMLDSVLSEDALIMPCKAILKACAMSLPDLWNSRRSLSKIEGFDHSITNTTLGACGELPEPQEPPLLPFFIWQCGEIQELSKSFAVMDFDFSKPISSCYGKVQVGKNSDREEQDPGSRMYRCSVNPSDPFAFSHHDDVNIACTSENLPEEELSMSNVVPNSFFTHSVINIVAMLIGFRSANNINMVVMRVNRRVARVYRSLVEFTKPGTCHGFALWMDWVMDAESTVVLSTDPDQRYWKQGVKLLAQPVTVGISGSSQGEYCSAVIEASFDPSSGELSIKQAFS